MFLINSRFPLVSATPPSSESKVPSPDRAPLLPRLRGQFAEFLNHGSPERLGILYLTTCVGLGYWPPANSLEAFLDSTGSPTSPKTARHHASPTMGHGFTCTPGYTLTPGQPPPGRATPLRHPIAYLLPNRVPRLHQATPEGEARLRWWLASKAPVWTRTDGYGNINPLSIDYACRPRLRSRLTLGGLTCPRNPWSIGAGVSHSGIATHACILTRTPSTTRSPGRFTERTTLPYQPGHNVRAPRLRRCTSAPLHYRRRIT